MAEPVPFPNGPTMFDVYAGAFGDKTCYELSKAGDPVEVRVSPHTASTCLALLSFPGDGGNERDPVRLLVSALCRTGQLTVTALDLPAKTKDGVPLAALADGLRLVAEEIQPTAKKLIAP